MNSRIFVLSLATLAVIPLAAFAPAAIFAQQQQPAPSQTPSQPAPTQTPPAQPAPQQTPTQPAPTQTPPAQPAPQQTPSQPAPTQTPPAQPAPQQTPSQPAPTQTPPAQQPAPQQTPAQPATQPAMPEPEPQTTGPTTTIEGAVTNVVAYGCGSATATAAMRNQPRPTSPSSMPGAGPASGVPSAQQPSKPSINPSPSTGQGCSAVLVITPGVNWAQVVQIELPASGENGSGLAGFGVPLRVVVGPKVALSTHDNADISLLDLPKGSVVKVDYAVRNDVPVATNIDVIWHAGQ